MEVSHVYACGLSGRTGLRCFCSHRLGHQGARNDKRSPELADRLVDLSISARVVFKQVLLLIRFFFMPITARDFGSVTYRMAKTDLVERFPGDALALLEALISKDGRPFMSSEAPRLLRRAMAADRNVVNESAYKRPASTGWFDVV